MSDQPVYYASRRDPALHAASTRARETFRLCWRELSWEQRRIVKAWDLAMVKLACADGDVVEHMWIGDLGFDGREITGTLLNQPNALTNVKKGDVLTAAFGERVGDWMLASGRSVLGAFSVHALRAQMPPADRARHDKAWGLPFPDAAALPPDGTDHPMALNMGPKLVEYLRAQPAACRQLDDRGFTMLHSEALAGNANIVAILLAAGADRNARTPDGRTARELAAGWPAVEALVAS